MRLVLASGSPRRRELLQQVGLQFEIVPADIDEGLREAETPAAYVERLALEKARAVVEREREAFVLAADTTVVVNGAVLMKPEDDLSGAAMLRRLSGRSHQVMTGVAVCAPGGAERARVVESQVWFRSLDEVEIAWYLSTGEGRDKAGGYAIQGYAGAFVEAVAGSPSNVIGLPLVESLELLREAGFLLPWSPR